MLSTVILGGGIIGLSTAFYLSRSTPSHRIHVLDSNSRLFACASGRAAGFITKDWFAPASAALGELSFRLHRELAEQHDGAQRWGYAGCTGLSVMASNPSRAANAEEGQAKNDWLAQNTWIFQNTSRADAVSGGKRERATDSVLPAWVRAAGDVDVLSTPQDSTVVDPMRLCLFLEEQCRERGVEIRLSTSATGVTRAPDGSIAGVTVGSGDTVECNNILIAAGAWSTKVFETLFQDSRLHLDISSLAGHSLVFRSPHWQGTQGDTCHAIFTTDTDGWSPEIFARPGGEIYVAGLNTSLIPLPELADQVEALDTEIERAKAVTRRMVGEDVEVVRTALCHRPIRPSGTPLLSSIPARDLGVEPGLGKGVFVASGHGPWGISMSLGTGYTMAEMLSGKETSVDISGLGL